MQTWVLVVLKPPKMDARVVCRLRSSVTFPPTARVNSSRKSARSPLARQGGSEVQAEGWVSLSGATVVSSRACM